MAEELRRYLVSVDLGMRSADREQALRAFDGFFRHVGLEAGQTRQTSGYVKGEIRSRVFGTVAYMATDFGQVIARLKRLDAAVFGASPGVPSRYFRVLDGEPAGVQITGPSPDDPIADDMIGWVNIEAEDSEAWSDRLAPLHDEDRSHDRDDHFGPV
ncbi:MAG: hypothetical protein WBA44_09055 [Mesorhizobium sp.]